MAARSGSAPRRRCRPTLLGHFAAHRVLQRSHPQLDETGQRGIAARWPTGLATEQAGAVMLDQHDHGGIGAGEMQVAAIRVRVPSTVASGDQLQWEAATRAVDASRAANATGPWRRRTARPHAPAATLRRHADLHGARRVRFPVHVMRAVSSSTSRKCGRPSAMPSRLVGKSSSQRSRSPTSSQRSAS